MNVTMDGQVAVITWGSRGIGLAIAARMAKAGSPARVGCPRTAGRR